MSVPLLFPDYQNSILNIPCTLLKHFGLRAPHGTLAVLEQELAAHHYQNIVLMVFDGMGMAVLEKNLPPESFLPFCEANKAAIMSAAAEPVWMLISTHSVSTPLRAVSKSFAVLMLWRPLWPTL